MAAGTIDRRRARVRAPSYRTTSADPLARRAAAPLGIGLDFEHERALVDGGLDAEVRHVARVVPLPRQQTIEYRPELWDSRNRITVALVAAIVVVALLLLPQPTVRSEWRGTNDVGRTYTVTPTAGISGEASVQR